jgi:hypothetical protein
VVALNDSIKWAAELDNVQEVSLRGTADFEFWKERLAKENLQPLDVNGHAQLLLIAADMKYKGIRFQELSFSVVVAPPNDQVWKDAVFLVWAFNTCRFFAFSERVFFKTPYYHGAVRVSTTLPASMILSKNDKPIFQAATNAKREPLQRIEASWEGPIYLPAKKLGKAGGVFYGRLRGETETFPFLPDRDLLTIEPTDTAILQALVDSNFVPTEWIIRPKAQHAKSKTYRRE